MDKTQTAPERLYTDLDGVSDALGDFEYVRNDLYDAQQATIDALTAELRHCIYELERDESRKPHRVRRAGLARAALASPTD